MLRLTLIALLLLPLGQICMAGDAKADHAYASDWQEEANRDGLIIYSRTREDSGLKEFKSVGTIEAPSSTVFAVLSDVEAFPSFMPYTAECRVLNRTQHGTIAYQRLDLPMVSDRDYTLRSEHSQSTGRNGSTYHIQWEPANDLGPAEKPGVQRVKVCEGGWLIEPESNGTTRATYFIYTDSGGAIPAVIAESGSRLAIRKIFAAVRKEVLVPKYSPPKS